MTRADLGIHCITIIRQSPPNLLYTSNKPVLEIVLAGRCPHKAVELPGLVSDSAVLQQGSLARVGPLGQLRYSFQKVQWSP